MLFQALAPNQPVPQRLAEAQARLNQRLASTVNTKPDVTNPAQGSPGNPPCGLVSPSGITALDVNHSCPDWCDTACGETFGCDQGDGTWCWAEAGDGAYVHGNGAYNSSWADLCIVNGTPQLNLNSDAYSGSWVVFPQNDRWARTFHCGYVGIGIICGDQTIDYWVTGNGGDYFHFGGYLDDEDP
jgi:hypothetical protein